MNRFMFLIVAPLLGGCASYIEAEHRLIDETRKGVALVREAQIERESMVEAHLRLQRDVLDAAFDADVKDRTDLTAEWVMDARKAYAAALEQLWRQRRASDEASAAAEANLDAVDRALQRLAWLAEIRGGWLRLNDRQVGAASAAGE